MFLKNILHLKISNYKKVSKVRQTYCTPFMINNIFFRVFNLKVKETVGKNLNFLLYSWFVCNDE